MHLQIVVYVALLANTFCFGSKLEANMMMMMMKIVFCSNFHKHDITVVVVQVIINPFLKKTNNQTPLSNSFLFLFIYQLS